MTAYSKEVDAYLERAAPFAKPILSHIRECVHQVCPEVQEVLKWGFPHFLYRGSILCSMASFKAHCVFGFWKYALMEKTKKLIPEGSDAMGQLGKLRSLGDLPSTEVLKICLLEAMELNDKGIRKPMAAKKPIKMELQAIPEDLQQEFAKWPAAEQAFFKLSPSHKREYIAAILEAKRTETRQRRIQKTIENLCAGVPQNMGTRTNMEKT